MSLYVHVCDLGIIFLEIITHDITLYRTYLRRRGGNRYKMSSVRLLKAVDPSPAGLKTAQVTITHTSFCIAKVFKYKNNNKHTCNVLVL